MKKLIILSLVACVLTACSTATKMTGTRVTTPEQAVALAMPDAAATPVNMTAKCSFDLNFGSTNMNMSGNLRMQRDKLIQIIVSPFGLFEAVRIEMTPSGMVVIDRMNKRYIECGYNELDFAQRNNLDFDCFQALMWGEPFVPGTQSPKASDFQLTPSGDTGVLTTRTNDLVVNFVLTLANGALRQTNVRAANSKDNASLNMQYLERCLLADKALNDKARMGSRTMPTSFVMFTEGTPQAMRMGFSLSNIKVNTNNEITPTQPDRNTYKRISASSLMNIFQ